MGVSEPTRLDVTVCFGRLARLSASIAKYESRTSMNVSCEFLPKPRQKQQTHESNLSLQLFDYCRCFVSTALCELFWKVDIHVVGTSYTSPKMTHEPPSSLPPLENLTPLFHVMVVALFGWNNKGLHLPAGVRHQSDSASQKRQGFSRVRRRCPRYGSRRRRRHSEGRAKGCACEGVLELAEAWAHACPGETTQYEKVVYAERRKIPIYEERVFLRETQATRRLYGM